MAQLAADIVDKCKYIHPSRTEEIEQLLLKLRKHVQDNPPAAAAEASAPVNAGPAASKRGSGRAPADVNPAPAPARAAAPSMMEQLPPAHMNELDDYLELLYQVLFLLLLLLLTITSTPHPTISTTITTTTLTFNPILFIPLIKH